MLWGVRELSSSPPALLESLAFLPPRGQRQGTARPLPADLSGRVSRSPLARAAGMLAHRPFGRRAG